MKIRLIAVGTRMPEWVQQGYRDYEQRLRGVQQIELIEIPLAKRGKNPDVIKAMAIEADAIEKQLRPQNKVVVLEVTGKPLSTPKLATTLASWQMDARDVAIIIGGPDGLDARFRQSGYEQWSLSAMTLPHPIVRILLIEQLYRGLMINANHPYHRE